MSPTNSMRTGSVSAAGNTSTMPPRTAKAPCSSTGSSREKPASTSRSASRCGSISVPARSSIEARSRRSCGLTRGSSAGCRRDNQPRRSRCCGVQRTGPRGGDAEMRRHAAIRIDLNRRQRQHGLLDGSRRRAFERAVEEPRVGRHLLHISIGRDDQQRHAGARARGADCRQRLARGGQARGDRRSGRRRRTPRPCRAETAATEMAPAVVMALTPRTFSIRRVEEKPSASSMRTTVPPRASTMSRPTMLSASQSAPLTRTSGWTAAINACGVSSSKTVTASTLRKDARSSARSSSGLIGRERSLVGAHRAVGVDRHNQRVAKRARIAAGSEHDLDGGDRTRRS